MTMQTITLVSSPSLSDAPYPRHPGIEDVLRSAPEQVHDLILLLAAMVREVGVDGASQALASEAVLRGAPAWPLDAPGLVEEVPGDLRHPLDPYKGVLRDSGQFRHRPYRVPPFNVIPAPVGLQAVCLPTVVAFAHGTKAPRGLAMALRLLREHLVRCGSGPKGLIDRAVIVVADAWSPQAAYESGRDLAAHREVTGLNVVAMQWDGLRWYRRGF
jgi:hypothetical protein